MPFDFLSVKKEQRESVQKIENIDLRFIVPNRFQPRKTFDDEAIMRLADSISRHGIIQPLTVRKVSESRYELVAGERRFRAAGVLNMEYVPCIVIYATNEESALIAIVENLQREQLDMFEQALAIEKLQAISGCTQNEVAKKLSLSQSAVANKLRLLRFDDEERELLNEGNFGERAARAFLKLPSSLRLSAIRVACENSYNSAMTERFVDIILEKGQVFTLSLEQKKEKGEKRRKEQPQRKMVIKDLRLFYNTLDNALKILTQAGYFSERSIDEGEDKVTVTICLSKKKIDTKLFGM